MVFLSKGGLNGIACAAHIDLIPPRLGKVLKGLEGGGVQSSPGNLLNISFSIPVVALIHFVV